MNENSGLHVHIVHSLTSLIEFMRSSVASSATLSLSSLLTLSDTGLAVTLSVDRGTWGEGGEGRGGGRGGEGGGESTHYGSGGCGCLHIGIFVQCFFSFDAFSQ